MNLIQEPAWLKQFDFPYTTFQQIPINLFDEVNEQLGRVISKEPLVSIIIAAWNEEINVLKCIASLSRMKTKFPFEIIVVNNNSTDQTQQTLDQLHVKSYFQSIQGAGPARQLGQEKALGEYVLTADADCLYPDCWVDEMMKELTKPGVVCVYGRYSFLSAPGYPRWKLGFFELLKDVIAEYRHINRPYFNTYGLSMGYLRKAGLEVGFIEINRRGEDGQLCLDLMKYGKVKQVRSNRARAWTGTRTLERDGSISEAFLTRFTKEFKRFFYNLHSRLPEDKS
jgi:glycosyltransferase involved in cell wall biosynthesis